MDRSVEAKAWRHGFAGGFLALALSIGGQAVTSGLSAGAESCSLRAQPGIAAQIFDRVAPTVSGNVAQRVVLAVLEAMIYRRCS